MKTLVAYYSQSGQTKRYGELISRKLNADVYEIKPILPYDEDMWKAWDEAQIERKNDSIRDIKKPLPDLSNYDLIIIGSGTWGYTLANPVFKFLRSLDFSGKAVSGFWTFYDHDEKVSEDLEKETKGSKYIKGLPIPRSLRNVENKIDEWIKTLR